MQSRPCELYNFVNNATPKDFRRERKKITNSVFVGSGAEIISEKTWPNFCEICSKFLFPDVKRLQTSLSTSTSSSLLLSTPFESETTFKESFFPLIVAFASTCSRIFCILHEKLGVCDFSLKCFVEAKPKKPEHSDPLKETNLWDFLLATSHNRRSRLEKFCSNSHWWSNKQFFWTRFKITFSILKGWTIMVKLVWKHTSRALFVSKCNYLAHQHNI